MIFALSAAAVSAPLRGQPQVLEGLREAVASRWEFQKRVPLSAKVFANKAGAAERKSMLDQLRGAASMSANPRSPGREDMWAQFASGMASELNAAGSGEAALAAAAQKAGGDLSLQYEAYRLLAQAGLYDRARAWQVETHRSMLAKGYTRIPELAKLELGRADEAGR